MLNCPTLMSLKTSVSPLFKKHREKLIQRAPKSVFVFPTVPEEVRSDNRYTFRQDSNLYYLTGFTEADSCLVVVSGESANRSKSILFVQDRDLNRENRMGEFWEGERYGAARAKTVFGVDETYVIQELWDKLPELFNGADRIYYEVGKSESFDRQMIKAVKKFQNSLGRSGRGCLPLLDPKEVVGEMRLFKSEEEIERMRKAAEFSAEGHIQAMRQVRPGMNEREVAALLEYEMKRKGCSRTAYGSIVAGGANAAVLHYHACNQPLNDGELLLIDAAGEYEFYGVDITRTFPIGKTYATAQAEIYDLVLKTQKAVIDLVRPGTRYEELQELAIKTITEGLVALGIFKGDVPSLIKKGEFKKHYYHGVSHFLGIDTHDVGLYKIDNQSRVLEPGMVLTIEPGVYFHPWDDGYPKRYENIGIRIEDDILVTPQGNEVLTKKVPKERAEIEKLRAQAF